MPPAPVAGVELDPNLPLLTFDLVNLFCASQVKVFLDVQCWQVISVGNKEPVVPDDAGQFDRCRGGARRGDLPWHEDVVFSLFRGKI